MAKLVVNLESDAETWTHVNNENIARVPRDTALEFVLAFVHGLALFARDDVVYIHVGKLGILVILKSGTKRLDLVRGNGKPSTAKSL